MGYNLDVTEYKSLLLSFVNIESDNFFRNEVFSGVAYDRSCRGGLSDVCRTQKEMSDWYEQKKGKSPEMVISRIHVNEKMKLVVGEVQLASEVFFTFLYNPNDYRTTYLKKDLLKGEGSNIDWKFINLDVPMRLKGKAYKLCKE